MDALMAAWFGKLASAVGLLILTLSSWRDHLRRPKAKVQTHPEALEQLRLDALERRRLMRLISETDYRERKS